MSEESSTPKAGLLLSPKNLKANRFYFNEAVRLVGIYVQYRAIRNGKEYALGQEIQGQYDDPITIGCLIDEHPEQKTMKKLGWVAELSEQPIVISMPYDTPNIQVGCLVDIPSGIDDAPSRTFEIRQMSTMMLYPASITCKCVPHYTDVIPKESVEIFAYTSQNVMLQDADDERE